MATFRVGDRVRIVWPQSMHVGREASVIDVALWEEWHHAVETGVAVAGTTVYRVNVDGYGGRTPDGCWIGYSDGDLAPLTNPDAEAWTAFKRYLQPDPAVILAKEPA